jgi:hypothetical protein
MTQADKTCFRCLCKKPLEAFYKHAQMGDGRLNKCIECTKADVAKHRMANLEKIRAYDKRRASQPHRVAKRLEVVKQYDQKFPARRKANAAVSNAVRDGRLQKWPCQVCGNEKSVGHHPDYDNPLGVVWRCQAHHKQAHALGARLDKEAA